MNYRIDKEGFLKTLGAWDGFLKRKVRLIACGGTALTLLGVKESTKDIDLIAPDIKEYEYLVATLKELGYKSASGAGWARDDGFVFDIFRGERVHTTQLLESPLNKGNHILVKEFSHIYLGALNFYDLIVSKLFRGAAVDIEDCLLLMRKKTGEINMPRLVKRFRETASFDVSEEKVNKNLEHFLSVLKKEKLYEGE